MKMMMKIFATAAVLAALMMPAAQSQQPAAGVKTPAPAATVQHQRLQVRVKDVARLSGNEAYTLTGYGVVVGLNGTGDSDASLIQRTISNIMQNFNIIVDEADVKAKNTACVMVTATIRGPVHKGDMIEANVSSVGDAKSLLGGELLLTPLLGADADVWAVAQGPVVTGGFFFGSTNSGGNAQTKNHPTVGTLTSGVKLLRDVGLGVKNQDFLTYFLREPDYTAAVNLAEVINKKYFGSAAALDSATIRIRVPNEYKDEQRITGFISEVEQLYFATDSTARVIFNEKTGTVVIGADVRISECAVSHGNLYVDVKKVESVSQPGAFTGIGAKTEKMEDETTTVNENAKNGPNFVPLPNTTTVGELVRVLNALGASPRDIMIIFHAIKAAGALHAELESI